MDEEPNTQKAKGRGRVLNSTSASSSSHSVPGGDAARSDRENTASGQSGYNRQQSVQQAVGVKSQYWFVSEIYIEESYWLSLYYSRMECASCPCNYYFRMRLYFQPWQSTATGAGSDLILLSTYSSVPAEVGFCNLYSLSFVGKCMHIMWIVAKHPDCYFALVLPHYYSPMFVHFQPSTRWYWSW